MKNSFLISIEVLHLVAGFSLVISGAVVYFIEGIEMSLSWMIFGAMYISMSDVGEDEMTQSKLQSKKHLIRRVFAYFGAISSVFLMFFYLSKV